MIRIVPLFALLLAAFPVHGSPDMERLLDAVWKAEGGEKTRFPYGIKAVRVKSVADARTIAKRTLTRALAERPDLPWIEATARVYCPEKSDPKGYRHWKKNVLFFYNKK